VAARHGAICYLDEVVEARQDTTVVIHPLTDHRRTLPLDKKGELVRAHADFQLVISYNPGYQSLMKDLKTSHAPALCGAGLRLPGSRAGSADRGHRNRLPPATAAALVQVAAAARRLKGHGLDEGISTRLLVYAASSSARASRRAKRRAWPWCGPSPTTPTSARRWTTPSRPCSPEPRRDEPARPLPGLRCPHAPGAAGGRTRPCAMPQLRQRLDCRFDAVDDRLRRLHGRSTACAQPCRAGRLPGARALGWASWAAGSSRC
jgi:hypothetical protein